MDLEERLRENEVIKQGKLPAGPRGAYAVDRLVTGNDYRTQMDNYAESLIERYGDAGARMAGSICEATSNLESHEYGFAPGRDIYVEREEIGRHVAITIYGDERCHGFDPRIMLQDNHRPDKTKILKYRGHGQAIINEHTDYCSYTRDGRKVTMVFDLDRPEEDAA